VLVSTGGFIEHVLTRGPDAVERYVEECAALGFDVLEISSGFITTSTDAQLRLIERVARAGLKPKPEIGIQFGAGGASTPEELDAEGTRDLDWVIAQARRFLDAGAYLIMIESEGITEACAPGGPTCPQSSRRRWGSRSSCLRPPTHRCSSGTSSTSART
jgi:phosphosulfolactate synthase (CoM biosynthesis protein A)